MSSVASREARGRRPGRSFIDLMSSCRDVPTLDLRFPNPRECCSGLERAVKPPSDKNADVGVRGIHEHRCYLIAIARAQLLVGPTSPRGRLWSQTGRSALQSQQSCPLASTRTKCLAAAGRKDVQLLSSLGRQKPSSIGSQGRNECGSAYLAAYEKGGARGPKGRTAAQRVMKCQAAAW